MYTRLG